MKDTGKSVRKGTPPRLSHLPSRGLSALIIGGALLLAVIWATTLELTSGLARAQVEHRMAHVAEKVREVMKDHDAGVLSEDARTALSHLIRFLNVHHLELLDSSGRVLWHGERAQHPNVRPPVRGGTVLEQHLVDGMTRTIARHYDSIETPSGVVHMILMADVSDVFAKYRQIGILLAKAFSSIVLAAIFLMGWLLILRWREERALTQEFRALWENARAQGGDKERQLRTLLEQAADQNATLLRQMLARAQSVESAGHASGQGEKVRHPRERQAG